MILLFRLYIHPLFTFYGSPHVKVKMIYMLKKNISTTMFFLSALNNFRDEKLSDFLYS